MPKSRHPYKDKSHASVILPVAIETGRLPVCVWFENMPNDLDALRAALSAYAHAHTESDCADAFLSLADEGVGAFERSRLQGHFTGSCWLVSSDGQRVLLTHHRKLDRWLQLGGHADGDTNLPRVALREAEEESGLSDLQVEPAIFDIDRHRIPARREVPEHWHYDVRYVVRAGADERFAVSDESHALAWRSVAEVAEDTTLDESMRRMANKWLQRFTERSF